MAPSSSQKKIYKVTFYNQGNIYELHAHGVSYSDMPGFVEVSELIFGERSTVLVDPSEEKLKSEFAGVNATYIPVHSVVRIDQVEREGNNKIVALDGKDTVTPFPNNLSPHGGDTGKTPGRS